ncbi:short-chain dehydrogenase [Planoprotostelium fungivorum]|uniref:Short-chain dehydrogenase n=1 Tax=Planoprotostelium fungivorum TaxID=1890364 RepID=A0A2P6NZW2_9EUKA|nr:short-chain dehydrogenase [Planoprotostelium fungivorum]
MNGYRSIIIITGGTSGVGYHASLYIAKNRPDSLIIIASRTSAGAAESINRENRRNNVIYLPIDLSDRDDVRRFAAQLSSYPPISALVLNAGLQITSGLFFTKDGIEKTLAVNHVGHALLFSLLKPKLTDDARIVCTSSGMHDAEGKKRLPQPHYTSAAQLAHPTPSETNHTNMEGRRRYAVSKLCNILFTYALHRRFTQMKSPRRWTIISMTPGLVPGTQLARDASPFVRWIWNHILPWMIPIIRWAVPNTHSAKESGENLAKLVIDRDYTDTSGIYYDGLHQTATTKTNKKTCSNGP